jgi:hypothetical protein
MEQFGIGLIQKRIKSDIKIKANQNNLTLIGFLKSINLLQEKIIP